jgi:hypothetical protein
MNNPANFEFRNNTFQNLEIKDYIISFKKPENEARSLKIIGNNFKDSNAAVIYFSANLFDISNNYFKNLISKLKLSILYFESPLNIIEFGETIEKKRILFYSNITQNYFENIWFSDYGTPIYIFYKDVNTNNYMETRVIKQIPLENHFSNCYITKTGENRQINLIDYFTSNAYQIKVSFPNNSFMQSQDGIILLEESFFIQPSAFSININIYDIFGRNLERLLNYNLGGKGQSETVISLTKSSNRKTSALEYINNTYTTFLDLSLEKDMFSKDENIRSSALLIEFILQINSKIPKPNISGISYNTTLFSDLEYFKFRVKINETFCKEGEVLINLQCVACKSHLERYNPIGRNCTKCENNLNCTLPEQPMASNEFFVTHIANNRYFIEQCSNKYACLGGELCRKGYRGMTCMSCETTKGYVKSGLSQCIKCNTGSLNFIIFVLGVILSPIVTILLIYYKKSNNSVNRVRFLFFKIYI